MIPTARPDTPLLPCLGFDSSAPINTARAIDALYMISEYASVSFPFLTSSAYTPHIKAVNAIAIIVPVTTQLFDLLLLADIKIPPAR